MTTDHQRAAAEILSALLGLQSQNSDAAAIESMAIAEKMEADYDYASFGVEANTARANAWFALARLAGALTYDPATPDRERLQTAAISNVERWCLVA